MDKIGIIAGSGMLPVSIGKNLLDKNYDVNFFCIKNFTDLNLYKEFEFSEIDIVSFSSIIKALRKKNINKIIMAGKIIRPSIKDLNFDLKTISLIKDFFLESKGDDQLLRSISAFFNNNGFPLFDWKEICHELFASSKHLTIKKPSKLAVKNMMKGLDIFKIVGKADIGQSLIIQNQMILGAECIEGTDELILRCSKYKKNNDMGILLKLSKYNQHNTLDLPAIGLETVKNIKNSLYEGIYIEKNQCIILEKENVIKFCNQNNLFLSTVDKIDR